MHFRFINLKVLLLVLVVNVFFPIVKAASPSWASDVTGGKDHPLIQRFKDSWMLTYGQKEYDMTIFPGEMGLDNKNNFISPVQVEGRVTRMIYMAPYGKTPVEVHRNYEIALKNAGFKAIVSCTPQDKKCDAMRFGFDDRYKSMKEANFNATRDRQKDPKLRDQLSSLGGVNMFGTENIFFTYGTLNYKGAVAHVMLNTGTIYSKEMTTTYIEIAEPKPMTTGQVSVNAEAIKAGLQSEGKMALYGIYFDTAKSIVKPESKPQLEQIAKLLKSQVTLKVYVVGHTDNQGQLKANLDLSVKRAQAVIDALVREYKIDAKRLSAQGLANLSPVSTNASEEGRSKNRRVEIVAQ